MHSLLFDPETYNYQKVNEVLKWWIAGSEEFIYTFYLLWIYQLHVLYPIIINLRYLINVPHSMYLLSVFTE